MLWTGGPVLTHGLRKGLKTIALRATVWHGHAQTKSGYGTGPLFRGTG